MLTQSVKQMLPVAIVVLAFISTKGHATEKLNIVYLVLDEWGYFDFGHMGRPE